MPEDEVEPLSIRVEIRPDSSWLAFADLINRRLEWPVT